MIVRVYERVCQARLPEQVWVATDDQRILAAVTEAGGRALLTSPDAASGSDRVAEAAERLGAELVANVQGDEPMIEPELVDQAIQGLLDNPDCEVSTLACPIEDEQEWLRPDVVKVVLDRRARALYFSRAPLPHGDAGSGPFGLRHLGLYVYRRETLERFSGWQPTPLEQRERLEQLRLLEHGVPIQVVETRSRSHAVDRPEDIEVVERLIAATERGTQEEAEHGAG